MQCGYLYNENINRLILNLMLYINSIKNGGGIIDIKSAYVHNNTTISDANNTILEINGKLNKISTIIDNIDNDENCNQKLTTVGYIKNFYITLSDLNIKLQEHIEN